MDARARRLFLALVLAQAAHSTEECIFRLYDVLAPARMVSELVSRDREVGFMAVNAALILLGFWCYLARVRPGRPSARGWSWSWAVLEAVNGTGHLLLSVARGGYFPGLATAPLLLACSAWLIVRLQAAPEGGTGGDARS